MSWQKPSTKKCPRCGAYMLEKGIKLVCSDEQCGYGENIENTKENYENSLNVSELYDNIDLLTKFFAFVYTT